MLVIYLCFFNVVYTFMSYISMPWLNQSGLLSLVVAPIVWRRCGQHRFMYRSSVVAACSCLRRRQVDRRQGLGFFCLALSRCYSCYGVLAVRRVASCRFIAVDSTTDLFLDVILLFSFFLHFSTCDCRY